MGLPGQHEAELHAHDIFAGKGDWQRMAKMIRARIGVYDKAFQAIADHDVTVIIRSVNIQGSTGATPPVMIIPTPSC